VFQCPFDWPAAWLPADGSVGVPAIPRLKVVAISVRVGPRLHVLVISPAVPLDLVAAEMNT
jgi:hypothetical protein